MNPRKLANDLAVLEDFVGVFCRENHGRRTGCCPACLDLLAYAAQRRRMCPVEPKPKCKDCRTHCYREPYRSQIRQVM